MAFRFGFFDAETPTGTPSAAPSVLTTTVTAPRPRPRARDVTPDVLRAAATTFAPTAREWEEGNWVVTKLVDGVVLKAVNGAAVGQAHDVANSRDVLRGVYEGGFKTWECTRDVVSVMRTLAESQSQSQSQSPPRVVMDVGCGAGLAGVYALQRWPHCSVIFQDLNEEVLQLVTAWNVVLNCGGVEALSRCRFVAGPWDAVESFGLPRGEVDLVVTADTLYESASHDSLISLIESALRPNPAGVALVAAKRFYFGCSGSVASFREAVAARGAGTTRVLQSFADGVSNIRDVVEWVPSSTS